MTTQEQNELKVVLRLTKWALAIGFAAAVTFGMWVAKVQGQASQVPALRQEVEEATRVMADLVLLQCADTSLNPTEQRICARYEPRMPR